MSTTVYARGDHAMPEPPKTNQLSLNFGQQMLALLSTATLRSMLMINQMTWL